MPRRHAPLISMLQVPADSNEREVHPLSVEAQVANLEAGWEHYRRPKAFTCGEYYRERPGLGMFKDDPVLLFVRHLNHASPVDTMLMQDHIERSMCNKVDCVVMRTRDDGGLLFFVHDSDLLEPLSARACA